MLKVVRWINSSLVDGNYGESIHLCQSFRSATSAWHATMRSTLCRSTPTPDLFMAELVLLAPCEPGIAQRCGHPLTRHHGRTQPAVPQPL